MPKSKKVRKPNPFENKIPQNSELKANRTFRDGLFRFLFSKNKEYALSLYNALNKTNYTDSSELDFIILKDVFFIKMRDDVSFMFDKKLTLYEHQRTYSPNMPLRGLFYFADLYRKGLKKKDLFKSSRLYIPLPQYIVFYNGRKKADEIEYLKLSDSFNIPDANKSFEWTATMININKNHNKNLKARCKILSDYSKLIEKIQQYNCHDSLENAILKAVDYCIEHNILADFLEQYRWEVCYLGWTDLDEKEYEEAKQEEIDEANAARDEALAKCDKIAAERDEILAKLQIAEAKLKAAGIQ